MKKYRIRENSFADFFRYFAIGFAFSVVVIATINLFYPM